MKWQLSYRNIRGVLNIVFLVFIFRVAYENSRSYTEGIIGWWHVLGYNVLLLLPAFLNNLVLLPYLRSSKKLLPYFLCLFGVLLGSSAVLSKYLIWLLAHYPGSAPLNFTMLSLLFGMPASVSGAASYFLVLPGMLLLLIVLALSYIFQQFLTGTNRRIRAEKEHAIAELNLLKYQVSPHFLFNVLNSLYALALKRSEDTPEVILKLSDILRYSLYQADDRLVSLEEEIRVLESYIAIERLRIPVDTEVIFDYTAANTAIKMAPVLLLPVVENAFKHGVASMAAAAYIRVVLTTNEQGIQFTCKNNYKTVVISDSGGIGLQNIRKRLALLYPGNHTLQLQDMDRVFSVTITIKL